MKHKHSTKASTSVSLLASSSVHDSSIKQQQFDDKLQTILNSPLGDSKIGNFIVNRILCSLDATNITNEEKIKYIKIIERFLSKFVQEMDKDAIEKLKFWIQLYNLVLIREHLKKGEESVIKYLLNSKVFDENLFNPNRLNDDNNLTLLDLLESLNDVLIDRSEIKKNRELIQWLKEKKGAKKSSEILQGKFNQEDYDKNIEKFKEELKKCSTQEKSVGEFKVVTKFENNRSKEFLECLDVILNNKRGEISQRIKLLLDKQNTDHYEDYVSVLDTLLSEYYKYIDHNEYIKIIHSIVAKIQSDSLRMIHYEELIGLYFDKIKLKSFLTKEEEGLLDEYTNQLVTLISINNNADNSAKHYAYKQRFNYYKYKESKEKTILQETIEVSLELIKYADSTQIQEDLYRLLIALYNIKNSPFKTLTLDKLVIDYFNLSGEVKEKFIKLFSYHVFNTAFVKKIGEDIEKIKQALSANNQEIRTTIIKFLQAFLMQTGECSINTIKEVIDDLDFGDSECILRILACLQCWSKNDIEKVNYQKVLDALKGDSIKRDPIINIKMAEFYLAIEELSEAKCCLDIAEKLLKTHKSFQYEIDPKINLNAAKLNLMFNAFADKNTEFLNKNWNYIKQIYDMCNAKRKEFSEEFHSIIDICQYHILTKDPNRNTSPNSQDAIKNIVNKITEDDEVTFSLGIIDKTISEKTHHEIPAGSHVGASSCGTEEYSSEERSNTEVSDIATQEDSLAKESFVEKCLNHWKIIHQYYQNIKKIACFSHDKNSDHPQENHQIWHISDEVSYTTKNKDVVVRLSKKHNNYASIDPELLGSLEISEQQQFTTALKKDIVKNPNLNGVKILGSCFLELKINADARLYASKIYENDNGAVLVIFDKKTDHDGIKRALRAENIECIKVFGGVDHSTQIEDYPLKCDVFPEDYSMYDVSCMGDI
ncbi:hypothetical protein [Candidatus Tisiphia endosymbiont of Oplodontha viridula]|uniref:hypothetical protein n=1 Tax=Candidatus Tisiphia endosymbiont of Oplodontha viridula TaxID=3077925 RepID=UPI0035C8F5AD